MSVISMMEMNPKSPFLWDWENLIVFNTKTPDPPKKSTLVNPETEGIELSSYFSTSDLSSKSASTESSNHGGKMVNSGQTQTQTSSTMESSVVSGESLIALELGKRTYFEDVTVGNNTKNCVNNKKCKLNTGCHVDVPRCQVEGCNLDLSSAKDYHRKHKVCEGHSKCPRVVINGVERRFCQQCSRFHGLTEFDQKKRSCRRRLSDHNARRRKPKPEVIQFNSMRLTPSLYEGRNQLSFGFNSDNSNPKVTVPKPSLLTSVKTMVTDELNSNHSGFQVPESKVSNVSTHLLPSKSSSFEVYQRGITTVPLEQPATNMEAATQQQQQRALSLLSTTSWVGPCDPNPNPDPNPIPLLPSQPATSSHPIPLPQPTEFWQLEEPVTNGSSFQLFKAANEPGFYLY